jgi:hypothetical protein
LVYRDNRIGIFGMKNVAERSKEIVRFADLKAMRHYGGRYT